ncbi:MAG: ATPase [Burkholderiales bacterium]|nr:ATPase [Burkholderiales bacterium]
MTHPAARAVPAVPAALYLGLDLGSSRTKVVLIDAAGGLRGQAVRKSGIDFAVTARACLAQALEMASAGSGDIAAAVATGYGRSNVAFVTEETKTEIGCLARGGYHLFPQAISIIDIGGQDNKVIKVGADGRRQSFKMNRKCAAGTGAFLEEMASRLDVSLETLNALAAEATEMIKLGSYCTVFSATEVLENIRAGRRVPDIVKGLFYSVIKRVLEMDSLTDGVVMTGGVVAHNPYLAEMTAGLIERPVRLPAQPQFVGALGAALFARDAAAGQVAADAPPDQGD